jgi:hypothetical protein
MTIQPRTASYLRLIPAIIIMAVAAVTASAQTTNPVKLVKGIVSDATTGKPVDGGMIFAFEGGATEAAVRSRINPKTGAYQMILSPATRYRLRIEAASYYSTEIPFTAPSGNEYQESEKNFSVKAIPMGTSIFSGQVFSVGSNQVKATPEFRKAVEFIKTQPYVTVNVMVANDPPAGASAAKRKGKGSTAPTAAKSTAPGPAGRADAVRNYLTGLGINVERVTISTVPTITPTIARKKGVSSLDNVAIVVTGVDRDIRR